MKKFLIILVIIALIILIYYQNRDSLHNYTDPFFVSAGQASSSNDLDRALIEAIMAEDTQKIEDLLSTDSSRPSDFLPMLRLHEKDLKIRSLDDLHKLTAKNRLYCENKKNPENDQSETLVYYENKKNPENDQFETLVNSYRTITQTALQRTPQCHDEILEFHVVHSLCTSRYENCASENPDSIRSDAMMQRGQKTADCMRRHMEDMNRMNTCISGKSKFDRTDLEQAMKRYCDEAVQCGSFSTTADCLNKYNHFFEADKRNGKDCTPIHITAMKQEFDILEQLFAVHKCDIIHQYEQYLHVETLFEQSKTIQEFSQLLSKEINRPIEEMRYHMPKLNYAYYQAVKVPTDPKPQDYMMDWTQYNACRIGQMPPK